ncbi:MAG: DNA polymerase III subunit delta [Rubricoccaceae bacterium]|nr:DNA polymerase III subunit delta [Rubricoccaceae bacterium]
MASKSGASYDDLATAFRHRHLQPLYFFYGEEGFLMDELQALLIEHALAPPERDFNLDVAYGPEASAPALLAQCAQYPMMAERRVVVVRAFEKLEENRLFTAYAERPNPHAVVLLLCNGKPNLSHHPYRALKQHAVWAEFKPLYDRQMPGWIAQRLKAKGYKPEGAAAQMIAEAVGPDLRTAATEVDKLAAYVGEQKRVTEDDVIRAAGHSREHNVFELQKAIGQGEHARALAICEALLGQAANRRSEAIGIVAVLGAYFTRLWKLSGCLRRRMPEKEMARHIGVSPFFLREYLTALRSFHAPDLARAFEALLAADDELKGGSKRDARLVLTLTLTRLRLRQSGTS